MATQSQRLQRQAAAHSRWHGADSPQAVEAKRDSKAAALEAYVSKVVSEAPEMTPEQLNRIAGLLKPTRQKAG